MAVILSLSLLSAGVATLHAGEVEVWLTRGDRASLLESRPSLTFTPGTGTHATRIDVDDAATYQSIEGFGAAITDSSAWLIQNELSAAQRDALLEELFSPDTGLGISFVRIPMGSSDFALTPYTYDDRPAGQTDPNLNHFSIAHDLAYIIPTLLQARALNPELKIMATPWTPPAWMKTSGSLYGGSLQSQYYASYAQYFVRFIQDYAAEGLPIHAVSVQNEPLHDSEWMPSAAMSTFQQSTFIGDHLGPALAAAGLTTKIIAYDHNWDEWNYPVIVLNDPEAGQYAAGASFHGYAGDVASQSTVHNYHPDKDLYFTEISGGDWAPNFDDNLVWDFHNIIIGATRHWAKTALFWNLMLDEDHGPHLPGGCTNCRGVLTVDRDTGDVTREVEYYAIGHASRFVVPGAVRINSDSFEGVIETVAFRNPDGTVAVVALNPSGSSRWFDVVFGGEHFSYRLTGRSAVTFVWSTLLPGDFNADGAVDYDDIDDGTPGNSNDLFDYLGQAPPAPEHDLDATGASAGVIDQADLAELVDGLIGSVIGDLDRDCTVTVADHALLAAGLGGEGGYFAGDLNADQQTNLQDFAILQANFDRQGPACP